VVAGEDDAVVGCHGEIVPFPKAIRRLGGVGSVLFVSSIFRFLNDSKWDSLVSSRRNLGWSHAKGLARHDAIDSASLDRKVSTQAGPSILIPQMIMTLPNLPPQSSADLLGQEIMISRLQTLR
jgi:hypothetical protein